jgi:hypothetical protein
VKSARDTVLQKYPEFADLLPEHGRDGDTKQITGSSTLFQYLYCQDIDPVIAAIKILPKGQLEEHIGSHTLLQYCAEIGLEEPTIALLDRRVDPNATSREEPRPPALTCLLWWASSYP